ncbi:HD domain-containing phosphohydrolase [Lachnoclostridium phytofermentans]|uniref:HD domain-containing phosphohydrolase n=1 Tax=Lachnoclostridium phytofermentans TaxID=66219 RepID=UPI0038CBF5B9
MDGLEIGEQIIQEANILIVDDVIANLIVLTEMIRKSGYVARPVTSVKQATQAIEATLPQLILLDISMPDMDGFEWCERLKKDAKTRDIPIIFISALNSTEDKIRGFNLGAVDFISKPFEHEEVSLRISTHLKIHRMQQELEMYNQKLQKLVKEQMEKIETEEKNLIYAMARMCEARDKGRENHIENIGKNCRLLAMSLHFSGLYEEEITQDYIDTIELASALHDIGKIFIPDNILQKRGKLTIDEDRVLKSHAELGAKNLSEAYAQSEYNDFLKMAIDIAKYHHEKYDGSGYPMGLRGKEIPLSARIVAVVNKYDNLLRDSADEGEEAHKEALQRMKLEANRSLDPDIIEVFLKIQRQLKR